MLDKIKADKLRDDTVSYVFSQMWIIIHEWYSHVIISFQKNTHMTYNFVQCHFKNIMGFIFSTMNI
jgi:hypothetical protein